MHSQVLLELPTRHSSSPRRSPVAMDVELGSPSAPNVVRHKSLKIPDLPQRGEDSPGHRLSVCMSEEFRPLSQATFGADANERTPVGDGLDQFRPLSPQASPTRHDELEKFRPLSPMSKAGQPVQPVDELDKYRPLSPASSIRSTVYPAERTLLPDSETEVQRLRLGLDDEPRKASPSTKDQDEAERRKSKESTRSALDEEIERQEAITKRLTMQLRSPKRLSPAVQQRALAALPATPVASRRSVSEPRLQQSPGAAPPGAMHSGWVPTGADSLEHRSSACMVEELRSPPQVPTAKFAAEGPTNRPVLPMQQGNQVVDAESEEMQRLRAELATAKASAGQEAAKLRAELTTARDAEALAASECAKLQRELTSRDAEELDRYRPLSTGSSIRSTAHLAERTLLPDSESLHPPGGGAAKSGVPWRRARGIAAAQDTCDEERRKSKESTRSADQETEREFAARRVASRAMMQVAPEPAFLAQLPGRVSPPVPATATPQASLRSASEPRLQRSAGTMTSGSGASSPSKERLRALESEVASQSKRIRVLEGELKTAESRASRLQASGAAAQKEIELTLAQLKASRAEVLSKSTRVKQLESKLMALENKVSESRKSKNDSSEVSVRSSKLAELEGKVNHLTKQLENSNRQLQESLETSIRSDISEDLQAERRRASEWQDRCEMLRQSLADRETSASQDLQETRQQLRDAENKVKQLSAELAGVREANAAHLALGSETEVRQLKQQLQQLEVEVELRKARAAAAEAQLSELAGELSDAKAARTRTLSQFKDIDAEMEGARRRLEKAEREKARAEGERREAEDRALGLRDECKRLKKELHDTKHTMRAIDSPKRAGTICATARADALMEAGAHFASLTDLSTSTGEVDDYTYAARKPATLTRHGSMGAISASEAKAERAAGALDEARRELKRQQKEAGGLRRELAVAVATALAAKAGGDSPPPRRRSGVRLRIEQEAAERLSLGLGAGRIAA